MKNIILLMTCMINGLPRSPVEGVQTVSDEEAKRFVEAKQAKYADDFDGDGDVDENDLAKKTVKQLNEIATAEGVTIPNGANKAALIQAIVDHREKAGKQGDDLDGKAIEDLREIAKSEDVELADDATPEVAIAAIREKRAKA
jgi:hypothetical protein